MRSFTVQNSVIGSSHLPWFVLLYQPGDRWQPSWWLCRHRDCWGSGGRHRRVCEPAGKGQAVSHSDSIVRHHLDFLLNPEVSLFHTHTFKCRPWLFAVTGNCGNEWTSQQPIRSFGWGRCRAGCRGSCFTCRGSDGTHDNITWRLKWYLVTLTLPLV